VSALDFLESGLLESLQQCFASNFLGFEGLETFVDGYMVDSCLEHQKDGNSGEN
jgi:hypothetical protein